MPSPNSLTLHCSQCKVSGTCPRAGSSPLTPPPSQDPRRPGQKTTLCRVVGGYGSSPVDQGILSAESKARSAKDGPCLTIAEVPTLDSASGLVYAETVKVFHHPIVHPRAGSNVRMDSMITRSHMQDAPRRRRS